MTQESMSSIVEQSLESVDLAELNKVKNGPLKKMVSALLKIALKDYGGAVESASNAAQFVLDYKEEEFFRKFIYYIFELKEFSAEKRVKFSQEIQMKAKDASGNVVLGMVDRLDNINKEKYLANLTKARIHGFISIEDFFRLSSLLERIPFVDLEHLTNYKEGYYDESVDTELLFATGALQMASIDEDDGNKYVLSLLGEKLMMYGLQEPVKVIRAKGTGIPVSLESISEKDIEEMFANAGERGHQMVQKAIAEAGLVSKKDLEALRSDYDEDSESIRIP